MCDNATTKQTSGSVEFSPPSDSNASRKQPFVGVLLGSPVRQGGSAWAYQARNIRRRAVSRSRSPDAQRSSNSKYASPRAGSRSKPAYLPSATVMASSGVMLKAANGLELFDDPVDADFPEREGITRTSAATPFLLRNRERFVNLILSGRGNAHDHGCKKTRTIYGKHA
jgi:hypothetical protein